LAGFAGWPVLPVGRLAGWPVGRLAGWPVKRMSFEPIKQNKNSTFEFQKPARHYDRIDS
jgi:hypothetical protein